MKPALAKKGREYEYQQGCVQQPSQPDQPLPRNALPVEEATEKQEPFANQEVPVESHPPAITAPVRRSMRNAIALEHLEGYETFFHKCSLPCVALKQRRNIVFA